MNKRLLWLLLPVVFMLGLVVLHSVRRWGADHLPVAGGRDIETADLMPAPPAQDDGGPGSALPEVPGGGILFDLNYIGQTVALVAGQRIEVVLSEPVLEVRALDERDRHQREAKESSVFSVGTRIYLESLTSETCCRRVKFVCGVEEVKDSIERGAGDRGGETRRLFMEMRTGFDLKRASLEPRIACRTKGTLTRFSHGVRPNGSPIETPPTIEITSADGNTVLAKTME